MTNLTYEYEPGKEILAEGFNEMQDEIGAFSCARWYQLPSDSKPGII